jgi:hypothetical protein
MRGLPGSFAGCGVFSGSFAVSFAGDGSEDVFSTI